MKPAAWIKVSFYYIRITYVVFKMHSNPQVPINVSEIQLKVWETKIVLGQHFCLTIVHKRFLRPPVVVGNNAGVNKAMSKRCQRQKKVIQWWLPTLISFTTLQRGLNGWNITTDFLFDFYQRFHCLLCFFVGRDVTFFSKKLIQHFKVSLPFSLVS